MAQLVGVSARNIRRWEDGTRSVSVPAIKVLILTEALQDIIDTIDHLECMYDIRGIAEKALDQVMNYKKKEDNE